MKIATTGVVRNLTVRRRLLFFKETFLMVSMDPESIALLEREVNARFPGYGQLGRHGCAINIAEHGIDPKLFPPGMKVEMTSSIGNSLENFFNGIPPLSLDSIRPLRATD